MKTEIRVVDHTELPGEKVIQLWFEGEFIGQVTGADGPGIRLITKYDVDQDTFDLVDVTIVAIRIRTH